MDLVLSFNDSSALMTAVPMTIDKIHKCSIIPVLDKCTDRLYVYDILASRGTKYQSVSLDDQPFCSLQLHTNFDTTAHFEY